MFDCGQHPFKLLRLRGDHSRAQVGVACYRSKRKNTLTNISLYWDILTVWFISVTKMTVHCLLSKKNETLFKDWIVFLVSLFFKLTLSKVFILPPIQLRLQLAVSSIGHYVLLPTAFCGDTADVQHKIGPFDSRPIWGPCRATWLPRLTAHLALLEEKHDIGVSREHTEPVRTDNSVHILA